MISFFITSIIQKIINRKRPFEVYSYQPLISHTKGKSFPSKHTLSASIIALSILKTNLILGTILVFIAIIEGCLRILIGHHYLSDVIGGWSLAALIYYISVL